MTRPWLFAAVVFVSSVVSVYPTLKLDIAETYTTLIAATLTTAVASVLWAFGTRIMRRPGS